MYEPCHVSKRYPFYRSEIVRLVLPNLIPLGHVHCMVKIQHLKKKVVSEEGCTVSTFQDTQVTKFFMVMSNICGALLC